MNSTFRIIAKTLQPYISDTYGLLNAADAVMSALGLADAVALTPHDRLVLTALNNSEVMENVRLGRKVAAVVALRRTNPGVVLLREAKEAVEDHRVWDAHAPH